MSKPIKYKTVPNQATDEMLNQARNLLGVEIDEEFFKIFWFVMWQAAPEVEQEPVGYLDKCLDFTLVSVDGKIPLYTHPQPKD